MSKISITICGEDKAELSDAALEVVALLSGAPSTTASKPKATRKTKDADEPDEPETPAKPKRAAAKGKVTKDDCRKLIQAAIKKHGEAPVKEVFTAHDAKKFSDFKTAKQFAAVAADIKKLDDIADEIDGDDDDEDLGL